MGEPPKRPHTRGAQENTGRADRRRKGASG
jgi:hypothetical protein